MPQKHQNLQLPGEDSSGVTGGSGVPLGLFVVFWHSDNAGGRRFCSCTERPLDLGQAQVMGAKSHGREADGY